MTDREPDGAEPPVPSQPWSLLPPDAEELLPLDAAFDDGPSAGAEPPSDPLPHETARLPEVAPDAAAAPGWDELAATQAMDRLEVDPVATAGPATAATVATGLPSSAEGSAVDDLFGDSRFREYQPGLDPEQAPFAGRPGKKQPREAGDGPRGPSKAQKVLLWVAGSVLAVLALIALFLVGLRLPELTAGGPAPTPSASPTPEPTATALPVGPVEPGVYRWDELLGGECVDPYIDPWQDEFTVVDCADPHPAQMVFRGVFPETVGAIGPVEYPGAEALQAQISLLCSAPGVVDLAAAGVYTDAQVRGSYPITAEQWAEDPSYYCFVDRSSGESITGSVAVPPPAEPEPEPEG
jgi:hypothetical protein